MPSQSVSYETNYESYYYNKEAKYMFLLFKSFLTDWKWIWLLNGCEQVSNPTLISIYLYLHVHFVPLVARWTYMTGLLTLYLLMSTFQTYRAIESVGGSGRL